LDFEAAYADGRRGDGEGDVAAYAPESAMIRRIRVRWYGRLGMPGDVVGAVTWTGVSPGGRIGIAVSVRRCKAFGALAAGDGRMAAVSVVLVVDDEPDLRFLLRRFIELGGHLVVEAWNGEAALQTMAEALPDLVVTDMMMPVMNGVELIRRLRAEPTTAAIPILAVSADGYLAVGADDVLAKPFNGRELIAAVERLLEEGRG
jgi:two-component system chemotaxis response regulator CheY